MRTGTGGGRGSSYYSDQEWRRKAGDGSSAAAKSTLTPAEKVTSSVVASGGGTKALVCFKCNQEGHSSKDCQVEVLCLICEKNMHVTARCVWPTQAKPVMQTVGLGSPDLGFFMPQHARVPKQQDKTSTLGLIQVTQGHVYPSMLQEGLASQFPWQWRWNVTKQGNGFLVPFPSAETLGMLVEFEDFKLRGSNSYIRILRAESVIKPKGRMHTIWARAEGVPNDMKHYKGICEIGSLIGAVEEVDMKILHELGIVRFKAHVKSVQKIPKVKEFGIPPMLFDVSFSVERIEVKGLYDGR